MDTRNPSAPGATGTNLPGTTPPGVPKLDKDPDRTEPPSLSRAGQEAPDATRDLKDSGKEVPARASDQLSSGARTAADQARQATSAATQQVSRLAEQAREQGKEVLNEQKERAAAMADDVAAAIRRAGEKLRQEDDQNLAAYTEAFADGAGSVARYLRQTDARAVREHAERMARRHPEWVLGGAYVVGLAVARFLKAARPEGRPAGAYAAPRRDQGVGEYGRGYQPPPVSESVGGGAAREPIASPGSAQVLTAPVAVSGEIQRNPEVH